MMLNLLFKKAELDLTLIKSKVDKDDYYWYDFGSNHTNGKRVHEILYFENVSKSPKFDKLYQFTYYYFPRHNPLVINDRAFVKEHNSGKTVGSKYDPPGSFKYTLDLRFGELIIGEKTNKIEDALKSLQKNINEKRIFLSEL